MPTTTNVFISYARAAASEAAEALRSSLAAQDVSAFVDTEGVPLGGPFPGHLAEALLSARVVVVFADDVYFQRTWCVHEFRVATAGFRAARRDLDHLIIALPVQGDVQLLTPHSPPPLAEVAWPKANETGKLAVLVLERLARNAMPLSERLAGLNDDSVTTLRSGALVPAATLPHPKLIAPHGLPSSLKERFRPPHSPTPIPVLTVSGAPGAKANS